MSTQPRHGAATAPQIAALGVVRDVGEGFFVGGGGLFQSAGAAPRVPRGGDSSRSDFRLRSFASSK